MNKKYKNILLACILGSLLLGGLLSVFIIPKIANSIAQWDINELLAAITLAGVIVAIAAPIIESYSQNKLDKDRRQYEEQKDKEKQNAIYQIDINVTTLPNRYVLFSAIVENVGDKTIKTKISNLYIDQGIPEATGNKVDIDGTLIEGAEYYKFPFILEHKRMVNDRPDCILCTQCRDDENLSYPEEQIKKDPDFKGLELYHTNIPLWHLSYKSIAYINPKEKFSEDVIVQFKKKGIYRVTLIVTTADGEADCECATKQFYIDE